MRLLRFLGLSVVLLFAANIARADSCTQDSRITPTNGGGGSPPLDPSGTFSVTVQDGCGTADLHVVAGTVEELTLTFNLSNLTAPNTCANILTGGGSNAFFTLPGFGFNGIPGAFGATNERQELLPANISLHSQLRFPSSLNPTMSLLTKCSPIAISSGSSMRTIAWGYLQDPICF